MKKTFVIVYFMLFSLLKAQSFESLKIECSTRKPETFVFSNKVAGFWMGNTIPGKKAGFSGWTNYSYKYIVDFYADPQDKEYTGIEIYPDHLERKHQQFEEELYFIDSYDITYLSVKNLYSSDKSRIIINFPAGMDSITWKGDHILLQYHTGHSYQPGFACIGTNADYKYKWDQAKHSLILEFRDVTDIGCAISLGYSEEDAIYLNRDFFRRQNSYLAIRNNRIFHLMRTNPFRTADKGLAKAYYWALISMDDLITRQGKMGIFAGYPWFNDYWGRDTFISLTGALLVTGKWDEAKNILLHFGSLQIQDSTSEFDGRIPNRIQLTDTIYNTADGTPWYFYALQRYVDYSGDTGIISTLFSHLKYFIESHIQRHCDSSGFILHGDAETWMDAVGPSGPWSPRGNRAVEIQALWMKNLEMGIFWAKRLHQDSLSKKWSAFYKKVRKNFQKYFVHPETGLLFDHLNAYGIPDTKIRPNMGFPILLSNDANINSIPILIALIDSLVFPYGVATLPQSDPDFHPYHVYPPYYVKDEAYHNGLIWVWLNGMVKSLLARHGYWDLYFTLLSHENRQIEQLEGLGSLSELLEPIPRKGKNYPLPSGTVSQAWSLAEYIRTFHEDLVGIRPKFLDSDSLLIEIKKLPAHMLPFEKIIHLKNSSIRVLQMGNSDLQMIHLTKMGPDSFAAKLNYSEKDKQIHIQLSPQQFEDCTIYLKDSVYVRDGYQSVTVSSREYPELHFVQPDTNRKWPVIYNRVSYDILKANTIKSSCQSGKKVVLQEKKSGEKSGYVYPKNPVFVPGIADLQKVGIIYDSDKICFRIQMKKLTDPGWHPGSGFQLTMILIGLQIEDDAGKPYRILPFNAGFKLKKPRKFTHFILIGNGIEIYDADLNKIAVYMPPEQDGRFGDPDSGVIEFGLPGKLFKNSNPKDWKIWVLSGLQDDHGGGGIGEFRKVTSQPAWWTGGGWKKEFGNGYDWLTNFGEGE